MKFLLRAALIILCREDKSGPIERHFFVSIHERVYCVSNHDEPADQGNVQTKLTASNEGKWDVLSIFCANSPPTRNPICGSFTGACLVSWFRNKFFGHIVAAVSNLALLRCFSNVVKLWSSSFRFTVKSVDRLASFRFVPLEPLSNREYSCLMQYSDVSGITLFCCDAVLH